MPNLPYLKDTGITPEELLRSGDYENAYKRYSKLLDVKKAERKSLKARLLEIEAKIFF